MFKKTKKTLQKAKRQKISYLSLRRIDVNHASAPPHLDTFTLDHSARRALFTLFVRLLKNRYQRMLCIVEKLGTRQCCNYYELTDFRLEI